MCKKGARKTKKALQGKLEDAKYSAQKVDYSILEIRKMIERFRKNAPLTDLVQAFVKESLSTCDQVATNP